MKWYKLNYVNRRDWVLDNLEGLRLSSDEVVLVLLIDFLNEHKQKISMEVLRQKSGLDEDKVDRLIAGLCARKQLEIRASRKKVEFILDGLYETDTAKELDLKSRSLIELFEEEFGRTLSNKEMQKISDWNRTIDRRLIIYALREASAYQKKSVDYIDAILEKWIRMNYTPEMIADGNVYES